MMYFEKGKCIQCGRGVVQTNADYNSRFNDIPADVKPAFCSRNCYDKMMPSRIKRQNPEVFTSGNAEQVRKVREGLEAFRVSFYKPTEPSFPRWQVDAAFDYCLQNRLKEIELLQSDRTAPEYKIFCEQLAFEELIAEYADGIRAKAQIELDKNPPAVLPDIPESNWASHALLLAQTRMGKTNVIKYRLQQLIPQVAQGKASIILMEPKGVLTEEVLRLVSLPRDRVVILDPMDTRVSVNIFDKGDGTDYAVQQSIARVSRVLNTITTTLTPFQQDCLNFALRAMYCADEQGSMRMLTSILRRGIKDLKLRELPYAVQEFFTHDFKAGDGSAQQVISRLNSLLANPVMEALFAADRTTFDMFQEIQAGKVIVINASAGDNVYARFFIEQVASCVTPRFKIPYAQRIPTTFIIDEAQTWLSEDLHFASMLDKSAEARISMLIALHHMGQIKDVQVRGSIYTNTSTKFSARSSEDIHALCRSMNCEPEFLSSIAQYEFGYFAPGMNRAIKVKFPLVEFSDQMTESQYQEMRAANRRKYSYVRDHIVQPHGMVRTQEAPVREASSRPANADPGALPMPPIVPPQKPPVDSNEDDGSSFILP